VLGKLLERRTGNSASRQGVLENSQVHALSTRFRAQFGHALDLEAAVFR
jgi:hypothetical protein